MSSDAGDEDLMRKVGAILHTVDGPVRVEAVAELCDINLATARETVEAFKQAVREVGGAVAECDHGLRLHADQHTVDEDIVARTIRWVHARHGLSPTEALLVDQHRQGTLNAQYTVRTTRSPTPDSSTLGSCEPVHEVRLGT